MRTRCGLHQAILKYLGTALAYTLFTRLWTHLGPSRPMRLTGLTSAGTVFALAVGYNTPVYWPQSCITRETSSHLMHLREFAVQLQLTAAG